MEKLIRKIVLAVALVASAGMCSATTMVFDTVTAYQAGKDYTYNYTNHIVHSKIIGIEKDTAAEIEAVFGSNSTSHSGNAAPSICTPSVITAMEKPGRYYLHVTWDENDDYKQVTSCMLELKN